MNSLSTASIALPAYPRKLRSGEWGAWVKGSGIITGTLIRVRTRRGASWIAQVTRVIWRGRNRYTGESGAICEVSRRKEDVIILQGQSHFKRLKASRAKCNETRTHRRPKPTNGTKVCPIASSNGSGFVSKTYRVLKKLEEESDRGGVINHRSPLFTKCTQCQGLLNSPSEWANGYCGNCRS